MIDISRKTYERNGIETIIDNDGILWSNEKHLEEGLDHKDLQEITTKYHSDHRKYNYELDNKSKNQCNIIFMDEKSAIKLIVYCRTIRAHKFRTRLGFKDYDVFLTKEQRVRTKIMYTFKGENMQTQYNVLRYRIDLYVYDYKLALKINDNGHGDRNIDYKIKRQKAIEQELGCKFIRARSEKRRT